MKDKKDFDINDFLIKPGDVERPQKQERQGVIEEIKTLHLELSDSLKKIKALRFKRDITTDEMRQAVAHLTEARMWLGLQFARAERLAPDSPALEEHEKFDPDSTE